MKNTDQTLSIKIVATLFFIVILLSILSSLAWAGGGSSPGGANGNPPSHRKPKPGATVYKRKGAWTIRGEDDFQLVKGSTFKKSGGTYEWDLKGAVLDGSNQSGKCDQNENNEPLFRASIPLIIKNGFIQNGKNALTFSKPNSGVEKMTWLNICEDAVSTNKGAENFSVIDSEFINRSGNDKSIQLNEAKGAVVKGNTVYSGRTCMRIGASDVTQVSDVATVAGNRFIGCDTAIHASKITVNESGNKFEGVNTPRKVSNGAKFK